MAQYKRVGRIIRLKPEAYIRYKQYHENCWDEVLESGKSIGIRNYSIYYKEGLLFSYYEIPADITSEQLSRHWSENPKCVEWEKIMHTMQMPFGTPTGDIWWEDMEEVFHQD